ncbi:MAG: NUDIX hydrolase [Methanomicrobiales archaeon]|nr:NUDIX hydrolase [Methanomicrobiales archaeon]
MTFIYQGRRLAVEKKIVRSRDGRTREWVVVRPADAAAILPLHGDTCYLIHQYRFAIDQYLYEVPAGTMDPGETPEQTAIRELREETGFTAGKIIPRGFVFTTPGFTTERIYLFEARDLHTAGSPQLEEDEVIESAPFSRGELFAMIEDGRICDAKTICLIHRCLG